MTGLSVCHPTTDADTLLPAAWSWGSPLVPIAPQYFWAAVPFFHVMGRRKVPLPQDAQATACLLPVPGVTPLPVWPCLSFSAAFAVLRLQCYRQERFWATLHPGLGLRGRVPPEPRPTGFQAWSCPCLPAYWLGGHLTCSDFVFSWLLMKLNAFCCL